MMILLLFLGLGCGLLWKHFWKTNRKCVCFHHLFWCRSSCFVLKMTTNLQITYEPIFRTSSKQLCPGSTKLWRQPSNQLRGARGVSAHACSTGLSTGRRLMPIPVRCCRAVPRSNDCQSCRTRDKWCGCAKVTCFCATDNEFRVSTRIQNGAI